MTVTITPEPESLFPGFEPSYKTRIYFGLGYCQERVKIGITSRAYGHRGGEMGFDELCSIPGGRLTEQMYHDRYRLERIGNTEWFHLSDRLLVDLYAMCMVTEQTGAAGLLRRLIEQRLEGGSMAA